MAIFLLAPFFLPDAHQGGCARNSGNEIRHKYRQGGFQPAICVHFTAQDGVAVIDGNQNGSHHQGGQNGAFDDWFGEAQIQELGHGEVTL